MVSTKLTPYELLVNYTYCVIPSGGGSTGKSPLVSWEKYQHTTPELEDLHAWEQQFHPGLWGVVTGDISCVVVIDIDKPELRTIFDEVGLAPHIQTPRGGFHYWFRHPGHPVKTVAGLLPGIDIRADGGFVNVIGKRKDGEYKVLVAPSPDAIYPWEKLPTPITNAMNGRKPAQQQAETIEAISEGERNATLAQLAGKLRRAGLTQEAIEAALQATNAQSCKPPLPEHEISNIARSIARYPTGNREYIYTPTFAAETNAGRDNGVTKSVTAEEIEAWISETTGWFSYEECDRELGIRDKKSKDNRRQVFKRLRERGIIECHPRDNKLFRYVNVAVRLIDFKAAGKRAPLAIFYPLGIHTLFQTFPGNVIVLAGAADAGKTAWLLNVIRQNMAAFTIYYQSSEMGDAELRNRLSKFEGIEVDDWNFNAEERSRDFADVIRPDCINIVDYLELSGDFFMVSDYLKQIHEKLRGGIAIVALQKKRNAELGRGGDFGLEKARLYLSMDPGKLTIQKAKNWAIPEVNPNGLVHTFKLVNGCQFIPDKDGWHKQDENAKR